MNISTLINTYFAANADVTAKGEFVPKTTAGNTVIPLIDGRNYFGEIRKLLERMGNGPNISQQFFYVTGWWNHFGPGPGIVKTTLSETPSSPIEHSAGTMPAFELEDNTVGPYPVMATLLAAKASAGVDVRVLSWVNRGLLIKAIAEREINWWEKIASNLSSINYLRTLTTSSGQPLAKRVCALTIGNLFGSMHLKMIVAFDGQNPWAFIGGMDLVPNRVAKVSHPDTERKKSWGELETSWHDMAVSITGPAVNTFYKLFISLWNEQLKRPPQSFNLSGKTIYSVETGTTPIKSRTLKFKTNGRHHIQVARTLPQFNFGNTSPAGIKIDWNKTVTTPLSFAPDGVFEIKVALKKAIENATKLIYMEDPAFWSHEVMSWMNKCVKQHPKVRVILLASWQGDPGDPPAKGERVEAINKYLLDGLQPAESSRIGLYLVKRSQYYVHAKVTIVDDYWVFVGSANCARRSLYTDGELAVGILDEDMSNPLAKQIRIDLWAEHLDIPFSNRSSLENLDHAFTLWPTKTNLAKKVEKAPLPLPPSKTFSQAQYDHFTDYDSRSKLW